MRTFSILSKLIWLQNTLERDKSFPSPALFCSFPESQASWSIIQFRVTMGKPLFHLRGVTTYYLSPMYAKPLQGWVSNTLNHVRKHLTWQGVTGLGVGAATIYWGDWKHDQIALHHRY